MKKVLVLVLGLMCAASASAEVKIGTVDMQKALQTVEAGKKARAELEKEFNTKKKDLQNEENAIKKIGEEFKKQSLVLSEEARAKKQNELQERIMRFQETTARSQADIQRKEQELTEPILNKIRGLISGLAKEKGYAMVIEKNDNVVLFSEDKDDLTDEVINRYNKGK